MYIFKAFKLLVLGTYYFCADINYCHSKALGEEFITYTLFKNSAQAFCCVNSLVYIFRGPEWGDCYTGAITKYKALMFVCLFVCLFVCFLASVCSLLIYRSSLESV